MKSKIILIMLFITFLFTTITTNVSAMEMDRAAMHPGEEEKHVIINDLIDAFFFDDALYREMIFYKTVKPQTYQVQDGDNLFRIAMNNKVDLVDLMRWNEKSDFTIHPGEELIIRGGTAVNESSAMDSTNIEDERHVATRTPEVELHAESEPNSSNTEMIVTATAYTAYCEGCSGTTKIGIDLRSNPNQKVIAVDPRVIPLGSKVWVEGYGEAIAGDTGSAIKGNKIDVFIPSYDQAMEWGRKSVKLKILN
ncbi:LysM peptidoglycan-binding and 3D domain-containing protein [Lysinibacillus sp. BW-2-10]|uniref:3D domain-containing protein n=1 Tax=Lysinibacillus sp. BW-2-10 TaxID=2590030 RepID=UPI00272DE8F1|nr:LysM peptidoglycan-binding and 3D domain-containing protein [Lysinibacillus sp. BW-2-10]